MTSETMIRLRVRWNYHTNFRTLGVFPHKQAIELVYQAFNMHATKLQLQQVIQRFDDQSSDSP